MSRVAVLGAGPSGLLSALLAAEGGHEVVVFEAADRVGGMAGSFEVAGQRVDYGSHRLHPATDRALMQRLRSLLGTDLQARQRNGRIRLRDRWIAFPLRTLDTVRSLPPGFGARVGLDTIGAPLRRSSDGTFAGEIRRRLGPTIHSEFYAPYARKLYGAEPEELDAELADRRVSASSPVAILRRAVRASRSDGRLFWYPKRGYGQIAEAIAEAAVSAGAHVRLGERVDQVVRTADGGWRVGAGGADASEADVVLSTIPLDPLAAACSPAPEPAVRESLNRLRVRAMVLVYLVVPRARYTPFDAHYFPDPAIRTSRLSEPKNYRDGDDPPDHTVLCAELAAWRSDDIWESSVAELAELVSDDLGRAGLPAPDAVHAEVRRLPTVYPVYETATMADRAVVDSWAASQPGLLSFGRQGLGVPDNLHHVLGMGKAAAQVVSSDGRIDTRRWAEHRLSFRANVVED